MTSPRGLIISTRLLSSLILISVSAFAAENAPGVGSLPDQFNTTVVQSFVLPAETGATTLGVAGVPRCFFSLGPSDREHAVPVGTHYLWERLDQSTQPGFIFWLALTDQEPATVATIACPAVGVDGRELTVDELRAAVSPQFNLEF